MAERISIRDLAAIAGVSRTTVSLALRDSHKIRLEVRKRIQDLAAKHNYQSHPLVASLMQQIRVKRRVDDEQIIAFITSDPTADEWKSRRQVVDIWEGASEEAKRFGFRLEWFWAGPGASNSQKLANMLYHRAVRGLLFAPMLWPHPVLSMPWEHFVPIACTASTGIRELPVVRSNQIRGTRLLLSKLKELGAKSIGVVITDGDDSRIERRWSLGVHGFRLDEPRMKVDLLQLPNYEASRDFAAWFKRFRPDVIVGLQPDIISSYLRTFGYSIGVDIAFASLDLSPEAFGPIAGFYQDSLYLGRKAVQYISKAIYDQSLGLPDHPESIVVDGRFIDGESLRPLTAPAKPVPGARRRA